MHKPFNQVVVTLITWVLFAGLMASASAAENAMASNFLLGKNNPSTNDYISDNEIRDVVARVAGHQIHHLCDGKYPKEVEKAKVAKAPDGIAWSYPWGVTLLGMERTAKVLGDKEAEKFVGEHNLICARYYHWLSEVKNQSDDAKQFVQTSELKGLVTLGSLDNCGAMGSEIIEWMINHPNQISPEEREAIARIADWVVHRQERLPDGTFWRPQRMVGTVWPDDLYMGGVFLVQDGIYTHDLRLIDDAGEQIIHQAALEQDSDGLWFHGYFVAEKRHAPFKWGRGNGWATVTMVETLSAMPKDDPLRPKLIEILRNQIAGLEKVQAPDGMWRQVLDKPGLWKETSCTAMFAYGIARAVNCGWVGPDNMAVARRAFAAVARNVSINGEIHGTCEGTSIGLDLNYYAQRVQPVDDPHGCGPVLLAGIEILSTTTNEPAQ